MTRNLSDSKTIDNLLMYLFYPVREKMTVIYDAVGSLQNLYKQLKTKQCVVYDADSRAGEVLNFDKRNMNRDSP